MVTCRRCDAVVPEGLSVDQLYELGWNEGLCPSCRAARNTLAARRAGNIASQLASHYAARWAGSRTVTIRTLPEYVIRSTWALGPDTVDPDMAKVWTELGDGVYLMTIEGDGTTANAVVEVVDGVVEMEPIDADQIEAVRSLAATFGMAPKLLN